MIQGCNLHELQCYYIDMISDVLAVLKFIDENLEKSSIFSAMFDWKGELKSGDKTIQIQVIKVKDRNDQWFYKVQSYKDYVFIPFPVIPNVYFDYGRKSNDLNPEADMFRFVSHPMSTFTNGGEKNLKVDFMVFGYKPSDLMDMRKISK